MNEFIKQYFLLLVIILLTFLGPLLGIAMMMGIQLPYTLVLILPHLSGYLMLATALLSVYALYAQTKLYKAIASKTDRVHFIVTFILLTRTPKFEHQSCILLS